MINKWIHYLLEFNFSFFVLTLFYVIILRGRVQPFKARVVLLCNLIISIVIPLINVNATIIFPASNPFTGNSISLSDSFIPLIENSNPAASFPVYLLCSIVYSAGLAFFLSRFLYFLYQLSRLRRNNPVNHQDTICYVDVNQPGLAFSFFQNVFISNQLKDLEEYSIILEHEKQHVRCRHSFDVLFFELLLIINWYNPLFYLYRQLLREVHEFEVDNRLLKEGVSFDKYLKSMLTASFNGNTALIVNRFLSYAVKRRIMMLRRSWKEEWSDFRIVYGIPFLLVVLVSLAFSTDSSKVSSMESQKLFWRNNSRELSFGNPVPSEYNPIITSGYGERIHPVKKNWAMHRGIDIGASKGTPVVAVADGQVVHVEENWKKGKNYGRYIVISHADNHASLYAQLSCYKINNGEFVKKGDVIGEIGASGTSTGYHLHFELKKDGKHVDPMLYIKNYVE